MSRICAGLDEIVAAFRSRRLDHVEFPYAYLDAAYMKVRDSVGQPASMAMTVATGATADGDRETLGCDLGDGESEAFRALLASSPRSSWLDDHPLVRVAAAFARKAVRLLT